MSQITKFLFGKLHNIHTPKALTVIKIGDKALLKATEKVLDVKDHIVQNTATDMLYTAQTVLTAEGRLGIAAPQLGINNSIFCFRLPKDCPNPRYKAMWNVETEYPWTLVINPEITIATDKKSAMLEPCASFFPGISALVVRPTEVICKYIDIYGAQKAIHAKGTLARLIQHEYDHLEGITALQRVPNTNFVKFDMEYMELSQLSIIKALVGTECVAPSDYSDLHTAALGQIPYIHELNFVS